MPRSTPDTSILPRLQVVSRQSAVNRVARPTADNPHAAEMVASSTITVQAIDGNGAPVTSGSGGPMGPGSPSVMSIPIPSLDAVASIPDGAILVLSVVP
jgi:hypothetical protein